MFTLLFADDTTFQTTSPDLHNLYRIANKELAKVTSWFHSNKLTLNVSKTKFMIFRRKNAAFDVRNLTLQIGEEIIERVGNDLPTKHFKFLGHLIDDQLCWKEQVNHVHSKISSGNYIIARSKNFLPSKIRLNLYNCFIRPYLEYGILAWGGVKKSILAKLITVQKKAIRNVAGKKARAHTEPLFSSLGVLKLTDLFIYNCGVFMHRYTNDNLPHSFQGMFHPLSEPNRTRGYKTARPNIKFLEQFPDVFLPRAWNQLHLELKTAGSHHKFKKELFKSLHSKYSSES